MKQLILFLLSVMLLNVQNVFACSPIPTTPQAQIAEADLIFEGRVVSVKGADLTFEVVRYWKGEPEKTIHLKTVENTCGLSGLTPGVTMVVFAKGNMTTAIDGNFLTKTVDGKVVNDTVDLEKRLGAGKKQ